MFTNANFRMEEHPNEPVFDWLTFDQLRSTMDLILQESVIAYDPAMQVIIFVYLPSESGNSVAMWRRKVLVPNNTRLRFQQEIIIAKAGLRKDKDYIVHVDEYVLHLSWWIKAGMIIYRLPPKDKGHKRGQSLPGPTKKKRKWWQILRFEK